MQIFIMWPRESKAFRDVAVGDVARKLMAFYGPLFDLKPHLRIQEHEAVRIVYLELPVQGWKPPYYEQDEESWALSLDYPVDGGEALRAAGVIRPDGEPLLPRLGRALQANPEAILERMAPPYVLVWSAQKGGPVYVQNDGLGFGQLYEYRDGDSWVLTNKVFALKALGIDPQPVAEEWAVKCTLGWLPLEMTGYRNLSYLKPATQLTIDAHGVRRARHDVLGRWLGGGPLAAEECLELGRISVRDYLRSSSRLWSQAHSGLTGGFDSRAVAATLISERIGNYYLRTRGTQESSDAIIAQKLASVAGVEHRLQRARALPPPQTSELRRSIDHALRWQAGQMEFQIHKTFLAPGVKMNSGDVNIMGQHGEIGRGFYLERINALTHDPAEFEEKLLAYSTAYVRPFMHQELREPVLEIIRQAYRQADLYGLTGCDRLDFFYLYERTRRWASGGQHSQSGKVIAPFLNPRYIRSAFALPPALRVNNPFHRHIVQSCMPSWATVPYQKEMSAKDEKRLRKEFLQKHRQPGYGRWLEQMKKWYELHRYPAIRQYQEKGRRNYNNKLYWQAVGQPLIDAALKEGGFWTRIYDPSAIRTAWAEAPDDLGTMYLLERICGE